MEKRNDKRTNGRSNKRIGLWIGVAMLALSLGIGAMQVSAFAGRLADATAGPVHKVAQAAQAARPANPGGTNLVISQVYGGGGTIDAAFENDFIEIFNPTDSPITMSGWSVQFAIATGSSWVVTTLNGVIPAGGYFLVQGHSEGTDGDPLPTPDAIGTINILSTSGGKIALANSGAPLSTCPFTSGTSVDFVGY